MLSFSGPILETFKRSMSLELSRSRSIDGSSSNHGPATKVPKALSGGSRPGEVRGSVFFGGGAKGRRNKAILQTSCFLLQW